LRLLGLQVNLRHTYFLNDVNQLAIHRRNQLARLLPSVGSVLVMVFVQRIACLNPSYRTSSFHSMNKKPRQALRVFNIAAHRPPTSGFKCAPPPSDSRAARRTRLQRKIAASFLTLLLSFCSAEKNKKGNKGRRKNHRK